MRFKQFWKSFRRRIARKHLRHSRINALEALEPRHLLTGTPTIFIDDSSASEGANEIFRIWLSEPTDQDVAVNYSTSNGTAIENADYVPASGTAIIPAAATQVNVTVSTLATPAADGDKEFYVTLSNPINGELDAFDWEATGSIIDVTPLVTVESTSGSEGQELVFNISLSVPSAGYVLVSYSSSDETAAAGSDYVVVNDTVTIPPGQTSAEVRVSTNQDLIVEEDEYFRLTLTAVANAAVDPQTNYAIGTIVDELPATISVSDAGSVEGEDVVFFVSLTQASDLPITVDFVTDQSNSGAHLNFTPVSGSVTFAPGETEQTVRVPTHIDSWRQGAVTFGLGLSNATNALLANATALGSVADADPALVSVNNSSAREGNDLTFTIALSWALEASLTVNFAFVDGTTSGNADFSATSTSVTFAPGQMERQVVVTTIMDGLVEGDEEFTLVLNNELPSDLNVALDETSEVGAGSILENHAPLMDGEPIELSVPLCSGAASIDLSSLFSDSDGDSLALAVVGSSNPDLVTGTLDGDVLLLTFSQSLHGAATILIRATDPVLAYVEIAIPITVDINNVPPTTVPFADLDVNEGAQASVIDLTGLFDDAIDDSSDLVYFASSDNGSAVIVTVDNDADTLTIDYPSGAYGDADVSVGALNSRGQSVQKTIHVKVWPVNDPPVLNPDVDLTLNENSDVRSVPLEFLFGDSDDVLSDLSLEIVSNSNGALVTADIDPETDSLRLTPAPNSHGESTLSIRATDVGGQSTVRTLPVVIDGNPVINLPANYEIEVDENATTTSFSVAQFVQDDTAGGLIFDIESYSTTIISDASLDPASGEGTLLFASGIIGDGNVVVRVSDARGNSSLMDIPISRTNGAGGEGEGPGQPTVSLSVSDSTAAERNRETGTFRIDCTGACNGLTVYYSIRNPFPA